MVGEYGLEVTAGVHTVIGDTNIIYIEEEPGALNVINAHSMAKLTTALPVATC